MKLSIKNKLIDFNKPKIFGILNLSPNSFFDGGKFIKVDRALKQFEKMLKDGADFIDIGAESSKPGSKRITEKEELKRLIPFLEKLKINFPSALFSVDTWKSKVAEESILRGASIINDISSSNMDKKMMNVISKYKVAYIMMHMKNNPETMQKYPIKSNSINLILDFFKKKIKEAGSYGIKNLIIDPGIGFGKSLDENFKLLKNIDKLKLLNYPIMIGISRKSMIYKKLNIKINESLNGTTILNTYALIKNANILRVHDVKEAKECVNLLQELK